MRLAGGVAITVSPSASTAAMIAFSVPVTLASSRKSACRGAGPRACRSAARVSIVGAERCERVDVGVEAAAADHVAAGRRDDRPCRSGRAAGPREESTRGSGCRAPRRAPSSSTSEASMRTSFGPTQSASAPMSRRSSSIVVDVADARDVRELTGSVVSSAGGEDRQRGVLVAGGAGSCPESGWPPSMTNDCVNGVGDEGRSLHGDGYPTRP